MGDNGLPDQVEAIKKGAQHLWMDLDRVGKFDRWYSTLPRFL